MKNAMGRMQGKMKNAKKILTRQGKMKNACECDCVGWTQLSQDMIQWQAFVDMATDLQVS
jgi:hypothetical protein